LSHWNSNVQCIVGFNAIGIIMTGMGDGARGLLEMREAVGQLTSFAARAKGKGGNGSIAT
jgi:chemotaxis response regulator CheB